MQFSVKQYDEEARARAYKRWDSIAKPLKGMGLFEDMVAQIEGMPEAHVGGKRCVLTFCADNGVVAEGVTQTGSEVTATVAGNMAAGGATACSAPSRGCATCTFCAERATFSAPEQCPARTASAQLQRARRSSKNCTERGIR